MGNVNMPLDDLSTISDTVHLDSQAQEDLAVAGKWGMFFAIFGFIATIVFLAGGVIMFFVSMFGGKIAEEVYMVIPFCFIMFIVCFFMFKFSRKAMRVGKQGNSREVSEAMKSLKTLFKTSGIMTLVFIGLCIVAVGIAAVFF